MFDEMLRQLAFLMAQYHYKCYEDKKIRLTVTFHISKPSSECQHVPMTISGIRSIDVAAAEHTAIVAAIRFLESATNTV
jgi:hypothetical protein